MYVYVYKKKKKITDSLTHYPFISLSATSRESNPLRSTPSHHGLRGMWDACTRVSITEKQKKTKEIIHARNRCACFELSVHEKPLFTQSAVRKPPFDNICLLSCRVLTKAKKEKKKINSNNSNVACTFKRTIYKLIRRYPRISREYRSRIRVDHGRRMREIRRYVIVTDD